MKRNLLVIILFGIIIALSCITIFQTEFMSRLKYKISSKTEQNIKSKDLVGEIYGIDVSHHQGKIEWEKVKKWKNKKLDFVYIKATEGATYIDKTYKTNIKEAKENDFLVGSYHYFRTTSSIENQFQNFIKTIDKSKQDLIPLIDVEEKTNWTNKEFHKNFKAFLNMVENYFGQKPMIYTVNSFYNLNLSGKYKEYHFLIGRYGENAPNMRDKTSWTIWQFSETGKVEGIPKDVDIDVLNEKYNLQDLLIK
ncbi:MAG: lysozyme [Pseudomonadales bacterium]|jgi:lysozyme